MNFRSAAAISRAVIAARIENSRSTPPNGSPSIISFRTASMYQRVGMMQEIGCNTYGMFSIGNASPENMMIGSRISMPEMIRAVACRSAKVEISSPKASERAR